MQTIKAGTWAVLWTDTARTYDNHSRGPFRSPHVQPQTNSRSGHELTHLQLIRHAMHALVMHTSAVVPVSSVPVTPPAYLCPWTGAWLRSFRQAASENAACWLQCCVSSDTDRVFAGLCGVDCVCDMRFIVEGRRTPIPVLWSLTVYHGLTIPSSGRFVYLLLSTPHFSVSARICHL